MAALGVLASLPEDHFLCRLCLKVFTDPVTTPCGHNFCKACLNQHWEKRRDREQDQDQDQDQDELCDCPTCNKRFHRTTEFSTNAIVAEMSAQVKKRKAAALESAEAPWCVTCDVCPDDLKLRAAKSCLGCGASFCHAHLEPHRRVPTLMKHQLVEPVENLQERTCGRHGRVLELFCRDEGVCVCLLCGQADHRDHRTVPVEEEGARQKGTLAFRKAKIEEMIGIRLEKINKLTVSLRRSKERANEETEVGDEVFGSLRDKVEEKQANVLLYITEKLGESQDQIRSMIRDLHLEIGELQKNQQQLEDLLRGQDHFQILQTLQALSRQPDLRDWSRVKVYPDPYVQTVRRALSHLLRTFQAELKTLTHLELTRMRQYKEPVTFDPSTAGIYLSVTESGTRLRHFKTSGSPPSSNSGRFGWSMVFGEQGFTCGRHYWEVKVALRGNWDVGVANESVDRTKPLLVKKGNGFLTIGKRKGDYTASGKVLHLCPRPKLVGVYVDYEEGRVSFYDVTQNLHLHSYKRERFTQKLFPCFYLHSWAKRSEALVITPIRGGASSL